MFQRRKAYPSENGEPGRAEEASAAKRCPVSDNSWYSTKTQYQLADMEFDSGPRITLKCVLMFACASLQRHLTPVAQNNL